MAPISTNHGDDDFATANSRMRGGSSEKAASEQKFKCGTHINEQPVVMILLPLILGCEEEAVRSHHKSQCHTCKYFSTKPHMHACFSERIELSLQYPLAVIEHNSFKNPTMEYLLTITCIVT